MISRTTPVLLLLACGPLPFTQPPATSKSVASMTLWKSCSGDSECTGSEKCGRAKTREGLCLQPCSAAGECPSGLTCNADLSVCLQECDQSAPRCPSDLQCLGPNGGWWCF